MPYELSRMTFNTNRLFKLIPFVWQDYDGERFQAAGFVSTNVPFLWAIFWWLFTIYDLLRYTILAFLPAEQRVELDFYLGKLRFEPPEIDL